MSRVSMPCVSLRLPAALLALSAGALFAPLPVSPLTAVPALAQEAAAPEAAAPETSSRRRRSRGRSAEKKVPTPPGMQQATPVAIFGDWNVFASGQGRTRLCYAIAQPTTRSPNSLKRDGAYFFVTVRKGENVQNEIAVMLGFPSKPAASQNKPGAPYAASDPTLALGQARYALVVKDGNAWLQKPAEEAKVVTEMSGRVQTLSVTTTSMRGNPTKDEYALPGFAEAMKRTRKECE